MANIIVRNIPNSITCCNLISGALATMTAFAGDYTTALTFIIVGAVFDFFDGFSARLLHVPSPIGKELDSLADNITFGLAPSAIVFAYMSEICSPDIHILAYVAFLIAAFSAIRLAKFNLDERQTTSFIGLPTPANALFWGAFIISMKDLLANVSLNVNIILLLIFLSCWMLIAEVPMFALKFKNFSFKQNKVRFLFIISSIILITLFLVAEKSLAGVWLTIVWYIILSLVTNNKK